MFESQTFKVARFCVRKKLNERDVDGEEWRNSLRRGDPWMRQDIYGPAAVQVSTEVEDKPLDLADVGQETGSEGKSTDLIREHSMAAPRLIPVPASPPFSVQLPPEPLVGARGPASSPFDGKCAPSQAPVTDTTSYDQLL